MLVARDQRFDLRVPGCASLKEKRHVVKTLTAALRATGSTSRWPRSTTTSCGSARRSPSPPSTGEQYHVRKVMHEVERFVERWVEVELDLDDRPRLHCAGGRDGRATRTERVGEEFREILAEAILKLKDPRVGFVTVTGVKVTPDLRRAWVFYTASATTRPGRARAAALRSARPHLRSAIGRQVRLKYLPELEFEEDAVARDTASASTS